MGYDEPEYTMKDINEWVRIATYTLFIWIIGYVFHDYYIIEGMEAGLWMYIFWICFITVYAYTKRGRIHVKKT